MRVTKGRAQWLGVLCAAVFLGAPALATADGHEAVSDDAASAESEASAESADAAKVEELEAKVDVALSEIDRLKKAAAVPFEGKLESFSGLGPAASKVYHRESGLSIGGYGEVRFRGQLDDAGGQNEFDALRAVLYIGYKFNDWIVLNSELEFEHGGSGGGGSVSTEFLTLDFLFDDAINARAGLLLLPMGFINEIHEPTFFFGAERPEVERRIMPTTWRENGAGLFGSFLEDRLSYRLYVVNGLQASGFDDNGFRGGRQKGSEALSDHFAVVFRLDAEPVDGLTLGGSIYSGKSGQNETIERDVSGTDTEFDIPDARTTIWEVHSQFKYAGAQFRGLYTQSLLENSRALSNATGETIAKRMKGGYVEFAYDLLPLFLPETEMSFEPFYRYERIDTQDKVLGGGAVATRDRRIHVVGFSFKPHPQVVLKLDYRNFDSRGGDLPDEVQAGIGYVF